MSSGSECILKQHRNCLILILYLQETDWIKNGVAWLLINKSLWLKFSYEELSLFTLLIFGLVSSLSHHINKLRTGNDLSLTRRAQGCSDRGSIHEGVYSAKWLVLGKTVEFPYKWNSERMCVVRLSRHSMARLVVKGVNKCFLKCCRDLLTPGMFCIYKRESRPKTGVLLQVLMGFLLLIFNNVKIGQFSDLFRWYFVFKATCCYFLFCF